MPQGEGDAEAEGADPLTPVGERAETQERCRRPSKGDNAGGEASLENWRLPPTISTTQVSGDRPEDGGSPDAGTKTDAKESGRLAAEMTNDKSRGENTRHRVPEMVIFQAVADRNVGSKIDETVVVRGAFPSGSRPTKKTRLKRKKASDDLEGATRRHCRLAPEQSPNEEAIGAEGSRTEVRAGIGDGIAAGFESREESARQEGRLEAAESAQLEQRTEAEAQDVQGQDIQGRGYETIQTQIPQGGESCNTVNGCEDHSMDEKHEHCIPEIQLNLQNGNKEATYHPMLVRVGLDSPTRSSDS